MATNACLICGTWFEAATERKKTCNNACRMELSRRGGIGVEQAVEDQTDNLLAAMKSASQEDIERLKKSIFPLELNDIGLPPLELRRKYGPVADLSTVLRLRKLPPAAALTEFMDE